MKFVEVYRLFSSTTSGQDEIYERFFFFFIWKYLKHYLKIIWTLFEHYFQQSIYSLSRDFGDIEEVKAILISRPFFDQWTISPDLLSLQNVVETCSTKFLKTIEVWILCLSIWKINK